ncbi:hypothetical protein GO755_38510 [Spirosoma sp. HMF4905]|uniref:Uncharacterized protein n=1 Tax=Spirosoma arboris TaxID=2682092 RepID=A0A7K1SQF0_9BACT|nr:hypothetical protein [Spirosoma arboris]MVM35970.1 hypothetical protein [Spirosoma arboris]
MKTALLPPSDRQIHITIEAIKNRLKHPAMNKPANRALKEGYSEMINILKERRETYTGINRLCALRAQAIAMLGVDYIVGHCSDRSLLDLPIKE